MGNKDQGSTGQAILFGIFIIIAILIFAAFIIGPLLLALYSLKETKAENKKWWAFAGLVASVILLLYVQNPVSSEEFGKSPAVFYGNVLAAVISSIMFFIYAFGNNEVTGSKKISMQKFNTKFLLLGVVPSILFLLFALVMHFQSPYIEKMVEENQEMLRIAEQTVNIRNAPTTQSAILLKAHAGDLFPYRSAMGNMWAEVELPEGSSGYVFVPLTLRAWKKEIKLTPEYKINFFQSRQNLLFSGVGAFFWCFLLYMGMRRKEINIAKEKNVVSKLDLSEENDLQNMFSIERSANTLKNLQRKGKLDPLLYEAARMTVSTQIGSAIIFQKYLHVQYGRSHAIVDQLEEIGIIGPFNGAKSRVVYVPDLSVLDSIFKETEVPKIDEGDSN